MIALKILHLLALTMALGGGAAALIVAFRAARTPDHAPVLRGALFTIAHMQFAGVVLLWLTGLTLWASAYAGQDLGGSFHAKLLTATLLTLTAGANWQAIARGKPLAPATARKLGVTTLTLGILTVIFAALTFS